MGSGGESAFWSALHKYKKEDHFLSVAGMILSIRNHPWALFPAQILFLVVTSAAIHLCLTHGKPERKNAFYLYNYSLIYGLS